MHDRAGVDAYVASCVGEVDEDGHHLVVRNGRVRGRRVTVGSGTFAIRAPPVNDKRVDEETGERKRFIQLEDLAAARANAAPSS